MPPKKKTHFTVTEAAKALGITRSGVHEAIRRGRLDYEWGEIIRKQVMKIRKKAKLITAADLEKYRVSLEHQHAGKKNP